MDEVVGLTAPVAHRCSPGSSGSASLAVAVVVSDGLRENGNFSATALYSLVLVRFKQTSVRGR